MKKNINIIFKYNDVILSVFGNSGKKNKVTVTPSKPNVQSHNFDLYIHMTCPF